MAAFSSGCSSTPEVDPAAAEAEKAPEVPRKLHTSFIRRGWPFEETHFSIPQRGDYGCYKSNCRCSFMAALLLYTQWQLRDPENPHLDIQVRFGDPDSLGGPAMFTVEDTSTGKLYGHRSLSVNLCAWSRHNREPNFYGTEDDQTYCWSKAYSKFLTLCFKKIKYAVYEVNFYFFHADLGVMYERYELEGPNARVDFEKLRYDKFFRRF